MQNVHICIQLKVEKVLKKLILIIMLKLFPLDTKDELIKIIETTNQAKDLNYL